MPVAPSLRASVSRLAPRNLFAPHEFRPSTQCAPGDKAGAPSAHRAGRHARGALVALALACASLLLAAQAANAQTTFEVRVAASLDDAEQFADSSMYVNSSDLELIHDTSDQTVGMRWNALPVPAGATITAAWIQFSSKESQSEATTLNFHAQAADNAPAFATSRYNIGSRPRTAAVVTWSPPAWTSGQIGAGQQTPDLKAVIQEVVSRPGWASGNSIVIIVDGTGHRTAWAWDGNTLQAPLLHVEYTTGSPPTDLAPVAALAVTQLSSPALTVSASGAGSTDTDATPIASYSFDWGDGSAATVVNAPNLSANHTYATAGTYTVTLTVKDTGGLTSSPKTQGISVSAVDQAPVAALAVTQLSSPAFTVSASGAGSTDTDATPIASYSFNWGDGSAATVVNAPSQSANHTYATAGTYTVTLTVKDTGGLTSSPKTQSISVSGAVTTATVEARIAASTDDCEEQSNGSEYMNSSDLELIQDSSNQIVGMRWTGLAIPQGATITAAWIQFSSKETWSVATNLTLQAQAIDNAATFTTSTNNVSSRAVTAASTAWVPAAWNSGETGANERSPDLSGTVQEVVSRPGWASGNALAIIVRGSGHRTAWSYDGNKSLAPLLHVEYSSSGSPPPTDQPPVAKLAVTQVSSPPLTVSASAAGSSDTDLTPIASYTFNWGDGSTATVVNAPTQTATHTYASAGTYTVTLTAKDTGGLTSAPVTQGITVSATDAPPVAKLAVSQVSSPALTVSASAAGSTDTDATPIASYTFNWGDGTSATVVNAPTQTATHTYASASVYTVTLTAKDTGGLTSAPVTASITVSPPVSGNVAVYVGYYDTHHPSYTKPKPNPWQGSAGVTFVGKDDDGKGNWDSCGLRVDNLTGADMTNVVVTCDIGSNHYALWGTRTIPANGKLILAQTAFQNFDGSDTSPAGCYGCDPKLCLTKVVSTIPVVRVTVGGTTTSYYDNTQVLNTKGADGAGCPDTGGTRNDESQQWKQIGTTSAIVENSQNSPDWVPEAMTFDAPAPNPVKDWMVIRYSLPRDSRVFVGFYDVAGRLVQIVLDREMPAGIYQQGVTLGNVNPGVYYCQIQTQYGSLHRSVVVSR
jgi:PKD repeat protein